MSQPLPEESVSVSIAAPPATSDPPKEEEQPAKPKEEVSVPKPEDPPVKLPWPARWCGNRGCPVTADVPPKETPEDVIATLTDLIEGGEMNVKIMKDLKADLLLAKQKRLREENGDESESAEESAPKQANTVATEEVIAKS